METAFPVPLPGSLGPGAWEEMASWKNSFLHWDFTHPSFFARPCPALGTFVERLEIRPSDDPLDSLLRLSDLLHQNFDYVPGSTSAVSPIDHILESGQGVCQDYAHVMIAIARSWGVPSRYVSGFMFPDAESGEVLDSATHGLGRMPPARVGLDQLRPPPTAAFPARATCASPWAATTGTCLQPGAF